MATKSFITVGNLGKALVKNAVTKLIDVFLSADSGNVLAYGSDNGIFYALTGAHPSAAINVGDTGPAPSGGIGTVWLSTVAGVGLVWWNGASWGQVFTSSGTNGGVLPSVDITKNGYILQVVAGAWAVVPANPFIGPIGGWPAIGGG